MTSKALAMHARTAVVLLAACWAFCAGAQTPGFYRMKLGDFTIVALLDGTRPMSARAALRNIEEAQAQTILAGRGERDEVATSFNAFLVDTGQRVFLVDAGAGTMFGEGLGNVAANLRAAGYRPEQVDEVLITHFHADHVGGLVAGGQRVFTNATVKAQKAEAGFWLSNANTEAAPPAMQPFFKIAQAATAPYANEGKLNLYEGAARIAPGIQAVPVPGHTPGHVGYLVESAGQKLMLWGDAVHIAPVQLAQPSAGFRADVDLGLAAKSRTELLQSLAGQNILIGGAHIPFPGLGRVRASGTGYEWIAIGTAP